jgi:hypothetical protein
MLPPKAAVLNPLANSSVRNDGSAIVVKFAYPEWAVSDGFQVVPQP